MSFFTGGGPLSEPVRIVYRQIRESLSVDPDIMEEVDGIVNDPVTVSGNPQSKVQELQNQAEELRVAFNRKHFMECNMSIFDVGTLEAAAKRYENAKRLLEIDSNPNSPISQRTILTSIFNTMQVQLDKKRKTWSEWRFILSFSCFVILLGAGNFMFWWSLSESNCIVLIEKTEDYQLWNGTNTISSWCMPKSRQEFNAISQGNADIIVKYLVYLTYKSSVLFNIAIIIASLLFGKILTNFMQQTPGVAGFRLNITPFNVSIPWIKTATVRNPHFSWKALFSALTSRPLFRVNIRLRHRDLDMECNVKYHIERYLDSKGIHVDILEYKFEDIRDLVQQCRLGDVEAGRQIPAAEKHARVTNVPTTPPQTVTVPSASYSGSTAYSSSGTPTSISRVPSPSADDSGSPLPKGTRLSSSPAETELQSRTTLELPNWPHSRPLLPSGSDTEGDISDSSSQLVTFVDNRDLSR